MPDMDGLEVIRRLAVIRPGIPIIILTAFAGIDTAIEAIRSGATDYLSKPFRMEQITIAVRRILESKRLARENVQYRQERADRFGVRNLIGQSPAMVEVYKLVARVAGLDTTVLIQGETGTGKELVARAIHHASPRADGPFVVVDCSALAETLFESELFGHERGAFTGALAARRGLFETAAGGTCLLDEIGELSPALQAKLLRALQEQSIRRVGGNEQIAVNVRMIAATNRDLRKRVDEGAFREDLYYRLNVVSIAVPPLRERGGDVHLLAQHFVDQYARAAKKAIRGLARETLDLLSAHQWPGNVRELENAIARAVALSSVRAPDARRHVVAAAGGSRPARPAGASDEARRGAALVCRQGAGGDGWQQGPRRRAARDRPRHAAPDAEAMGDGRGRGGVSAARRRVRPDPPPRGGW